MNDPIREFRAAMLNHGLSYDGEIIPGKIHRFPGHGKCRSNRAGWYIMFDDMRGGAYGDYSTGVTEYWQADNTRQLTAIEREQQQQAIIRAQLQRRAEDDERHRKAAIAVGEKLSKAKPETGEHRYLRTKQIGPHGTYTNGFNLLIPISDIHGNIQTLQTISPQGDKRFFTGGKIAGGMFRIGAFDPHGTCLVCEGFATAATLCEETGHTTVAAMNAGNLLTVCQSIRHRFRDIRIVVAADNDRFTEGNPGITKARQAALAVGGGLIVPEFPDDCDGTDYNDLINWQRQHGGQS